MNSTMLVIVIVVVAAVVIIGLVAAFAAGRGPGLRALPEESRERFAGSWRNAEARFIEDPRGAVRDADRIAVMVLTERGATIDDDRTMPKEMRMARDATATGEGRQVTEGMRRAMAHYRQIVEDAVGREYVRRALRRREIA